MKGDHFVDTNILVHYRDPGDPIKQKQSAEWLSYLWHEQLGRISFQVLNEFYVTVTQKLSPGLDIGQARLDINNLMSWNPIVVDQNVIKKGWSIQDRYGFSWWDSLIVAAAHMANCKILLSENLQHQQNIDGLTIINPFLSPIETVVT